jgi:DNA-binding CsgD family transcriptional regulator
MNQKQAARALNLSPRTVYNQDGAARQRLGVRTVHELIRRVGVDGQF